MFDQDVLTTGNSYRLSITGELMNGETIITERTVLMPPLVLNMSFEFENQKSSNYRHLNICYQDLAYVNLRENCLDIMDLVSVTLLTEQATALAYFMVASFVAYIIIFVPLILFEQHKKKLRSSKEVKTIQYFQTLINDDI